MRSIDPKLGYIRPLATTKVEWNQKSSGEARFTGKLHPDPEIPSVGDEAELKNLQDKALPRELKRVVMRTNSLNIINTLGTALQGNFNLQPDLVGNQPHISIVNLRIVVFICT